MSFFTPGLWIAQRFSFARKRFRVINIISAISLAGIIVGVSTLLIVLSVLNGFQQLAWDLFTTVESPVQVLPATGRNMEVSDALLSRLEAIEEVTAAEPFAEGQAILAGPDGSGELVMVKGITPAAHDRLQQQSGRAFPFFRQNTISVGEILAYKAHLQLPQEVKIFSPELISTGLESLSQPWLLPALSFPVVRVESIFSLQRIFNEHYVLTSRQMARTILLQKEDEYSGIDIRGSGNRGEQWRLQENIEAWMRSEGLEESYRVRPLEEKYRDIFGVMQIEKWVSFSILMLVILVAALSLTGSLTMTAIDKQKELFYLRCLGLDRRGFLSIFLVEGIMIGGAGTLTGMMIAWLVCSAQQRFGLVELPSKSAFIIDAYPVSMVWSDFVIVACAAMGVSVLVSLYPAFKAVMIAENRGLESKAE
ncbi:ABC transporter permease [Prosthecochloris sp. N3]|uniref:ABC transporter permease n=1 Tax=Prosthecochloris ethylica TaxID=2743976 RepID=A0ABR9XPI0_9CHLB|nr:MULTISPECIES: FtsX-like permease family protein [Prosthecochloris]MBF0586234.1 ABC transporter permease [Prosthecochloris ethylica]MBF0635940.1 ABC transporter permease [Prosthecochloris ethylica]NUK47385.1 ABC transporter permease [Prosthecochloris ethylica]RNA64940.1 ABC transporter permease [Prosthecochloris sp. ZM_2]